MSARTWTTRLGATVGALGIAVLWTGVADAQGDPSATAPAPITISSDQVKQICEQRVPKATERITKLTNQISGGPEVVGSVKWLRAQADRARTAGHPDLADRLDKRAERRSDELGKLNTAQQKLTAFTAAHCSYAGATTGTTR